MPQNTIIASQSPAKKYQLAFGIVAGVIAIVFIARNHDFFRSAAWWLYAGIGTAVALSSPQLLIRLLLSPQHLTIRNNTLTVTMAFKPTESFSLADIDTIERRPVFDLIVESACVLTIPSRNRSYLIAKPFYYKSAFDEFIDAIKDGNPKCRVDPAIYEWQGPYSAL